MKKSMISLPLLVAGAVAIVGLASSAGAQYMRGYPYQSGEDIYKHICQGCHMPDGKGATTGSAGTGYPALAGDARLQAPLYPVMIILRGQKAMPTFSDLNDDQVAAVVNYIRSQFGNSFPGTVTPDQVKTLRGTAVEQNFQRPG